MATIQDKLEAAAFDFNECHAAIGTFFERHNAPRFDLKAYRAAGLEMASGLNDALAVIKILRLQVENLRMEVKSMQEELYIRPAKAS